MSLPLARPFLINHTDKTIDLHHLPQRLLGAPLRTIRRTKRHCHHHKLKHTEYNSNNNTPTPILYYHFPNNLLPRLHALPLTQLRHHHKPAKMGPTSHESFRIALSIHSSYPPLLHLRFLLVAHCFPSPTPPTRSRRKTERILTPLHLSSPQLFVLLCSLCPQSNICDCMGRRRTSRLWLLRKFPSWIGRRGRAC